MREIDDQDLKAEIDEISKKIDSIIQKVDHLDPAHKEKKDDRPD
jgi:hypothetical protein